MIEVSNCLLIVRFVFTRSTLNIVLKLTKGVSFVKPFPFTFIFGILVLTRVRSLTSVVVDGTLPSTTPVTVVTPTIESELPSF